MYLYLRLDIDVVLVPPDGDWQDQHSVGSRPTVGDNHHHLQHLPYLSHCFLLHPQVLLSPLDSTALLPRFHYLTEGPTLSLEASSLSYHRATLPLSSYYIFLSASTLLLASRRLFVFAASLPSFATTPRLRGASTFPRDDYSSSRHL